MVAVVAAAVQEDDGVENGVDGSLHFAGDVKPEGVADFGDSDDFEDFGHSENRVMLEQPVVEAVAFDF